MAAAASTPANIPRALIASVVRNTCSKYTWNKRDSTYKTFLKHLKNFADEAEVSLKDMAGSSIAYARDVDYSTIPREYISIPELTQRFQNIPFVIHVDENNITTVVINKGNVDCPLTEITPDMMQVLSYLGVVRVFVKGNFTIPLWSDNIVHLDVLSISVMQHLDENQIPFPKYLRGLIDKTDYIGTYTNRLPDSLITLTSACTETHNLSSSLKEYTFTGKTTTDVLANTEYLTSGIRKVIYSDTCREFYGSEITMPPGTEYLEIGFARVSNSTLIIRNVKKLYIHSFKTLEQWKKYDSPYTNLTYECSACDGNCCNYYTQHVDVIFEEGIEHLLINIMPIFERYKDSIELLKCITHIPASLHSLLILDKTGMDNPFSLDATYPDSTGLAECQQLVRNFMTSFPHIQVSIEPTI